MPITPSEASLPGLEHADVMLHQIDHRSAESFRHAREIRRGWGQLEPVLTWCKQEMRDVWRWQMVDMSTSNARGAEYAGRYIFYFDSERDVVAFSLRWC
jgi:hypothetical protein